MEKRRGTGKTSEVIGLYVYFEMSKLEVDMYVRITLRKSEHVIRPPVRDQMSDEFILFGYLYCLNGAIPQYKFLLRIQKYLTLY